MIIMEHYYRYGIFAFNLCTDGISNSLICHTVTVDPGVLQLAWAILRWVVHIVLEEPEQFITNLVIVLSVRSFGNGDIP